MALALLLLAPGCRATELSEAQQTQVAIERDQPAGPLPTYVLPRTDVIGPLHAPAPGEGVGWNLTP